MEQIIGHSNIREELKNMVRENKVSHAYIFEGPSGIGKYLVAKEFAKEIMCEKKDGSACNNCESCRTFENSPDSYTLMPEKEGFIKKEEARSLIEIISLKPVISNRKTIIIRDAENMQEDSQNVLLKILEEPPEYATIILTTANRTSLINTIKSRCINISFNKLSDDEVKKHFEGQDIKNEIIEYSNGSIGKAEKLIKSNFMDIALEIIDVFNTNDILKMNAILEKIKENKKKKNNITEVLDYMIFWYYKHMKENPKYIYFVGYIEECKNNMQKSANTEMSLDTMMINIWKQK